MTSEFLSEHTSPLLNTSCIAKPYKERHLFLQSYSVQYDAGALKNIVAVSDHILTIIATKVGCDDAESISRDDTVSLGRDYAAFLPEGTVDMSRSAMVVIIEDRANTVKVFGR